MQDALLERHYDITVERHEDAMCDGCFGLFDISNHMLEVCHFAGLLGSRTAVLIDWENPSLS